MQAAAAATAASQPTAALDPGTGLVPTTAVAVAGSSGSAPKRQLALPSTQAGPSNGALAGYAGNMHASGACALDKDGKPVTLLPVVRHSLTEELHALLKLVMQVCCSTYATRFPSRAPCGAAPTYHDVCTISPHTADLFRAM